MVSTFFIIKRVVFWPKVYPCAIKSLLWPFSWPRRILLHSNSPKNLSFDFWKKFTQNYFMDSDYKFQISRCNESYGQETIFLAIFLTFFSYNVKLSVTPFFGHLNFTFFISKEKNHEKLFFMAIFIWKTLNLGCLCHKLVYCKVYCKYICRLEL